MTPETSTRLRKEKGAKQIDLPFTDLRGRSPNRFRIPSPTGRGRLESSASTARRFAAVGCDHESDMLLVPDPRRPTSIRFFVRSRRCAMISDVVDPITRQSYGSRAACIARKPKRFSRNSGIADTALLRRRSEFFIFDNIHFRYHAALQLITTSTRGRPLWISGARAENNLGYRPRTRKATSRCRRPTTIRICALKCRRFMQQVGIVVECHHHEVATGGQAEIDQSSTRW